MIFFDMDILVFFILIISGELIFDEKDFILNVEKIFVVDDGKF